LKEEVTLPQVKIEGKESKEEKKEEDDDEVQIIPNPRPPRPKSPTIDLTEEEEEIKEEDTLEFLVERSTEGAEANISDFKKWVRSERKTRNMAWLLGQRDALRQQAIISYDIILPCTSCGSCFCPRCGEYKGAVNIPMKDRKPSAIDCKECEKAMHTDCMDADEIKIITVPYLEHLGYCADYIDDLITNLRDEHDRKKIKEAKEWKKKKTALKKSRCSLLIVNEPKEKKERAVYRIPKKRKYAAESEKQRKRIKKVDVDVDQDGSDTETDSDLDERELGDDGQTIEQVIEQAKKDGLNPLEILDEKVEPLLVVDDESIEETKEITQNDDVYSVVKSKVIGRPYNTFLASIDNIEDWVQKSECYQPEQLIKDEGLLKQASVTINGNFLRNKYNGDVEKIRNSKDHGDMLEPLSFPINYATLYSSSTSVKLEPVVDNKEAKKPNSFNRLRSAIESKEPLSSSSSSSSSSSNGLSKPNAEYIEHMNKTDLQIIEDMKTAVILQSIEPPHSVKLETPIPSSSSSSLPSIKLEPFSSSLRPVKVTKMRL